MPTGRRYGIAELREEFRSIVISVFHKPSSPNQAKMETFLEETVSNLEHIAISYAKECYTEEYGKIRKEAENHRAELLAEFKTNREDWFEKKQSLLDELASEQEANRAMSIEIDSLRRNVSELEEEFNESDEVVGIVERMEDEIKFLRSALMAHATNEGKR